MNSKEVKYIFPSLRVDKFPTDKGNFFQVDSLVRKKHTDDKYYLIHVIGTYRAEDSGDAIAEFVRNAYATVMFHIIDPDAKGTYGEPVNRLDENQEDEYYRVFPHRAVVSSEIYQLLSTAIPPKTSK